jgi:hypothetical protein
MRQSRQQQRKTLGEAVAEIPKDQAEYIQDYVKEMNAEQRRQAEAAARKETRRAANRKKYGHEPGEDILTFTWKEIMSFIKA